MDGGLRCPQCGKSIPAHAGQPWDRVMCVACGGWVAADIARQTWEQVEQHKAMLRQQPAPARPDEDGEQVEFVPPVSWPRPPEKRGHGIGWHIGLALLAAAAGAAATAMLLERGEGASERALAARVLELKSEAEQFVKIGDLAEAHNRYKAMEQLVAGREIKDPALREDVLSARAAQEKVFALLLERQRPARAAADAPTENAATRAVAADAPADAALPLVLPPLPSPEGPSPAVTTGSPQTLPSAPPVAAPPKPAPPAAPEPVRRTAVVRRPPVAPVAMQTDGVSDDDIGAAIRRGADFLLRHFQDGALRVEVGGDRSRYAGLNALCVYALLQCGQAMHDERLNIRAGNMKLMVDRMREMPIVGSSETYARAIRATALAVYNRPEDRAALKEDVAWLINASRHGAYTYTAPRSTVGVWDNSNSQYGLLGVWSGAEVGVEVPRTYWTQVQNHWFECQHDTGEWGYGHANQRDGRPSMTVAGLASLFVTHDYLDAPQFGTAVGREPFSKPLARGLQWLEKGDNCLRMFGGFSTGYTLYGLERVGLASGFKYFGRHDWYRALAAQIVRAQLPGGGWSGGWNNRAGQADLIETAYALLFLARGRHPILMNKLRFDGAWANRPRDVANLARFATRELERPINWQVVPLDRDWSEWMDCPILYIASHQPMDLDGAALGKLRRFVEAGGLIFTQADGNSAGFDRFAIDLGTKLFPEYEWMDLPPDHELFTLNFQVDPRPKLKYLSNGSRLLMVHSPQDIAQHWQLRAEKTRRYAFDFGLNLFIYAAGKADLRNRLNSPYLPPTPRAADFRLRLARVKHAGVWDPEPHAIERFARWFEYRTGYALSITAVDAAALDARAFPVAHLTGAGPHAFTSAEVDSLRRYVEDGGTLLIDACGGSWSFNARVADLLSRAFPGRKPQLVSPTHPILAGGGPGMELLPRPLMRIFAEQKLGRGAARLEMLASGDGRVIHSPLDITTGLLGTGTWSILGYRSDYALALLRNIVLWAADGCPDAY